MAIFNRSNQDVPQFGSAKPANTGGSQHCAECELMLADVLDGTLSAAEQARFDEHLAGCSTCAQMLADAQRGAAWLDMLRSPRPQPPAALLDKILAQTSGQTSGHSSVQTSVSADETILPSTLATPGNLSILPVRDNASNLVASDSPATILPFRSRIAAAFHSKNFSPSMLQPRLAMTAAMAFFSIGLTLNLTGVHLNQLHAADLKPVNLRRSFYQANAHVVRYYDNLRVVYELESRVRDLQRSSDSEAPVTPESSDKPAAPPPAAASPAKPAPGGTQPEQKQAKPRPNSGTSRRQGPNGPISLLASFHADRPASPPRLSASLSTQTIRSCSTSQEGDLV